MEKEFIKEVNIIDRKDKDSYRELMGSLEKVKQNIEKDYNNMQFIYDKNLVDYYTYKIKAEEAQYGFLLQEAKNIEQKWEKG